MKKRGRRKTYEEMAGLASKADVDAWNDYVDGKTDSPNFKGWKTVTFDPPTAAEIKAFRKSADLTQKGLGESMNMSARAVQQWEQGLRKPDGAAALLVRLFRSFPKDMARLISKLPA